MTEPFTSPSGSRWFPDGTPPQGQRAALHRLAAALRECHEHLMDTEAGEAELIAAAEAAERFAARLAEGPQRRPLWGFAESSNSGDARALFDSSPVIGLSNPVAPPLRPTIVGDHVEAKVTFGSAYEGPPGHVHGGIVAAAFDEVLGMAQSLSGAAGMTGTLTIKYRQPTPLGRELTFVGRVERREGRKIFASGTLHAGDVLCAQAEGVFVSVDFERIRRLAEERS